MAVLTKTANNHAKIFLIRSSLRRALGYFRNCKTKEKITQNRKTAKNYFSGDKWGIQSKLH